MLRRLLDSPWTYFVLAGVLLMVAVLSQVQIRIPSRPEGSVEDVARLRERDDLNVIFILIDTLRADRLGAYGYRRPTTPIMDDLASRGIRFAHAEAQSSWTKCSMASLWSGVYPPRTGITRFNDAVPEKALLPAEILRAAGFRTGGIWRNGWVAPNFGFQQGFETYIRPQAQRLPERVQPRPGATLEGSDEDVTYSAIEFLKAHGHERFFLYLHYMDVHQYVYDGSAAELAFGTSYSDHYDSAIHWVDRNVGELMLALEDSGLFKKTIVVIGSDHGEAFYEHGFEGHARNLYREVTEVPLIFALPFRLEKELVVEPLVRNVDVWPTLLDMLGLPPLEDADGRSLLPLVEAAARGEPDPDGERTSISFLERSWGWPQQRERMPIVAYHKDGKRLIFHGFAQKQIELFDHEADPREQRDLAKSAPEEVVAEMKTAVEAHLGRPEIWGAAPQVEVDDMYKAQLRALGYALDGK